ncbi:MAG: U32 family peptidase [Candidatus Eisenbacteria bacterium]|uniref:U32 family peptidase n=1 Tax=Eiseniibacteriota bacterium TaxID=2212470 RepID=A0A956LYA4_UNCEI|nr:U32 family peptidase [Candidatus Eisenbacteria bacterium]
MIKPEVLAPAGSPEALQAAIHAGADAIYLGVTDYNARVRARNFTLEELPETITEAHRWGTRVYVTFNTLVFSDEESAARRALAAIIGAGADALIVQDLGVVRWVRAIAPELPVHASTQMTVTSADGIAPLARLGVRRVILGRELSIPEIARIRAATEMELEVFVHGALCVSYSGQCLSSEAWGGRSANRGQCAQACRLPYDLMVDDRRHDLGDRAYLLSPRDLEGYRRIPELVDVGIATVKIEGRMKGPEYVSAATRLYRSAVDRAWQAIVGPDPGATARRTDRDDLDGLAWQTRQVFSRGASEGFLGGVNHQILVDGRTRSHRGIEIGRVLRIEATPTLAAVIERTEATPLAVGDGLLLAVSPLEEDEQGGRIQDLEELSARTVRIRFPREGGPDLRHVPPGTPVYRTAHPELLQALRRRLPHADRAVDLAIRVRGTAGRPLEVAATDPEGRTVRTSSSIPLATAQKNPLDRERLSEQLGRLGDTRYALAALDLDLESTLFLPVSELNRIRRALVADLEALRSTTPTTPPGRNDDDASPNRSHVAATMAAKVTAAPPESNLPGHAGDSAVAWAVQRAEDHDVATPAPTESGTDGTDRSLPDRDRFEDRVLVLCRDRAQMEAALSSGSRRLGLDFLDLVGLKEATRDARASGASVTLALPRIQKPGEEKIESYFLAREPDALLVRSLASLERLRRLQSADLASHDAASDGPVLIGDVSLNGVNPTSIAVLLELGLDRITPGLDLNGEQLQNLLRQIDPSRVEIPLHHHLPVFHTEHCVFAAFLSDGADFRTCGRPCDRHRIALRDRTGQEHPVIADVGCRNTVFGARPQSTLPYLDRLRRSGVGSFRIELVSESPRETSRILGLYREVWSATRKADDALLELRAEGRYGVSTGSPEPARQLATKPVGGRREAHPSRHR